MQQILAQESAVINGAVLLTITSGDSPDKVRTLMAEGGYSFPVLLDPTVITGTQIRVFQAYGVSAIPATFFIDREGVIRHIKIGSFENTDEMSSILDSIR